MENNEFHKKIGDCISNIESGSREWQKDFVKPGIKSASLLLIESSRERIHSLIDEEFDLRLKDQEDRLFKMATHKFNLQTQVQELRQRLIDAGLEKPAIIVDYSKTA